MSYDDSMIEDEIEGSLCPRCGDWHMPDGMTEADRCQRGN